MMKSGFSLALLLFLAVPSFAQTTSPEPLGAFPIPGASAPGWDTSSVLRQGGDCASPDSLLNAELTTAFDNDAGGQEFGQSFTAPCSGIISSITFVLYNTGTDFPSDSAYTNMLLFEGAGTSGTLLATEPYTAWRPAMVGTGTVHEVEFQSEVQVTSGQVYTFFVDQLEGDIQIGASNFDAYAGGGMYFTTNGDPASAVRALQRWDLTFRVDLLAPLPTANEGAGTPSAFELSAVYPNPIRSRGSVSLRLDVAQDVRIAVYDVLGREVVLLHEGMLSAERHSFALEGGGLPSGLYFVSVRGASSSSTRKFVVAR